MNHIISDIKEVTPAWLTDVLSRNGHLEAGEVVGVDVTSTGETGSANYAHLMVHYSGNAVVAVPQQLFIKYNNTDKPRMRWHWANPKEIIFYEVISGMTDLPVIPYDKMQLHDDRGRGKLPVIPCYEMQLCEETSRAHLLLADMSPTHMTWGDIPQPTPTSVFQGHVACLARLHGSWWEHPRLGRDISRPRITASELDRSSD